ncbi:hypothetical protein Tco_0878818 [Tanacetum coccineum]|uniref:Uncharacterized protein n=1 Tax=Tanacetum coccineum TaxID=301880 RepID=A0ABQ5C275_9ASTR
MNKVQHLDQLNGSANSQAKALKIFSVGCVAEPTSPDQSLTTKELEDQHAAILEAERQEAFEMEARQSQVAEQIYYDSLLAQRLVEEEERVQRDKAELSSMWKRLKTRCLCCNLTDADLGGYVTQLHTNPI